MRTHKHYTTSTGETRMMRWTKCENGHVHAGIGACPMCEKRFQGEWEPAPVKVATAFWIVMFVLASPLLYFVLIVLMGAMGAVR